MRCSSSCIRCRSPCSGESAWRTVEPLRRLGIRTVGELADTPRDKPWDGPSARRWPSTCSRWRTAWTPRPVRTDDVREVDQCRAHGRVRSDRRGRRPPRTAAPRERGDPTGARAQIPRADGRHQDPVRRFHHHHEGAHTAKCYRPRRAPVYQVDGRAVRRARPRPPRASGWWESSARTCARSPTWPSN